MWSLCGLKGDAFQQTFWGGGLFSSSRLGNSAADILGMFTSPSLGQRQAVAKAN